MRRSLDEAAKVKDPCPMHPEYSYHDCPRGHAWVSPFEVRRDSDVTQADRDVDDELDDLLAFGDATAWDENDDDAGAPY